MEYAFKFTVISAVYKVEPFLREAIDSLIAQDIGFEHVQLILVDDGSPDNCGAICDEYAARYPKNIQVIHKENGGVSSARNVGLMHAKGRFVNFMDSDDKLSPETLREVYQFFMQNLDRIDIASIPMVFFDGKKGQHILNYKYNRGNRVIDMDREWASPQLSLSSSFVKLDCIKGLQFDTRLAYAEDAQLTQKILANKCALGVVATGKYLYRRRSEGEQSALQTSAAHSNWYMPCLRYFQEEVIRFYLEKYGYVPRFVQYTLMYDLQWRVRLTHLPEEILTAEGAQEYKDKLCEILQYIEDDVILAQKNIWAEHKLFALKLKHGREPRKIARGNDVVVRFDQEVVTKLSDCNCRLEFVQLDKDACVLEGCMPLFAIGVKVVSITALLDDKAYPCEVISGRKPLVALDEAVLDYHGFRVSLPLSKRTAPHRVRILVKADDTVFTVKRFSFGVFSPIGLEYTASYYMNNGWKLTVKNDMLCVTAQKAGMRSKSEWAFCKEVWKKKRQGARKAVLARFLVRVLRTLRRRPLWLISDRVMKAGDNGEAFFRYMREHHREIDARFVISENCADYAAMRQIGPVLKDGSLKQKLYTLVSDYVISSQAEVTIYNPFHGHSAAYRDLLAQVRFVFLQHGVTKDDISDWLNRYNKNLYGFVTAARPEYQSIVDGHYYYTDRETWLTGFPRFDRLYHAEDKCITLMPTWRRYLMGSRNKDTDVWSLSPQFENSAYRMFYDALLNHERLLAAAEQYGYRIDFLPHPNLQAHLNMFRKNDCVQFLGREASYRDIYARSELVITDYSSAVFDFAYLRKPVMYTQFDAEEFFAGEHVYTKGYFDYERDGFGEVTRDLESTVDCIIEYMKNGCQLKDKYRERIDGFFAFDDQNNCQRVYERIMELEK